MEMGFGTGFSPRVYQKEALDASKRSLAQGINRQLIVLPTGTGKTMVFAMVIKEFGGRALVLAHRKELLNQAAAKIELVMPGADVGILQADNKDGLKAKICVASVQTAKKYLVELAERNFKLCICDEAHHSTEKSYTRIFRALGFFSSDLTKLLLGVTATDFRLDEKNLGEVFDEIVFRRDIKTMIDSHFLCPVRGVEIKTGVDVSGVKVVNGEFHTKSLGMTVNTPERNALIADKYIELGEARHGVVFCVNINHALAVRDEFIKRGIPCEALSYDMSDEERARILSDYRNHNLKILTNVNILTEGWDEPDTDIILMARPTKSQGLYIQSVGRGLRLCPGKTDCLVMDFVDIASKYDLCRAGTLLKLKDAKKAQDGEEFEQAERTGASKAAPVLDDKAKEIELAYAPKFVWHRLKRGNKMHYKTNAFSIDMTLVCYSGTNGYTALAYDNKTFKLYELTIREAQPDYAQAVCEEFVRRRADNAERFLGRDAKWRNAPASKAQIEMMKRNGIAIPDKLTGGEADKLIFAFVNDCKPLSAGQVYRIKKDGLFKYPELLNRYEGRNLIGLYRGKGDAAD